MRNRHHATALELWEYRMTDNEDIVGFHLLTLETVDDRRRLPWNDSGCLGDNISCISITWGIYGFMRPVLVFFS